MASIPRTEEGGLIEVYEGKFKVLLAKFDAPDSGANILEELQSHPGPGRLVRASDLVTTTKGTKSVRAGHYWYYMASGKPHLAGLARAMGAPQT